MTKLPSSPGAMLRGLLFRQPATQEQLAQAAGVSRLMINSICNGRRMSAAFAAKLEYVAGFDAEKAVISQALWDLHHEREMLDRKGLRKL